MSYLLRTFLYSTHPHKGYHEPISKMHMPPLDLIASWPTPNYVDPVMRGPANIIITLIFFPLVFLIVGVRIYMRLRISRSFGADDWLILLCLVCASLLPCWIQLRDLVAYNGLRDYQPRHGATLWMEQTHLGCPSQ
jgi:hypothetical protein